MKGEKAEETKKKGHNCDNFHSICCQIFCQIVETESIENNSVDRAEWRVEVQIGF